MRGRRAEDATQDTKTKGRSRHAIPPGVDGRSPSTAEPAATVFVVDDDISVRESLEGLVLAAGFRVQTFASAQEFLERPLEDGLGCLVLDLNLPDLGGLELQEMLARVHRDLPVVFVTGHGDIPSCVRAMKAGAVEFLTKPFSDEELLKGIRVAVDRHRATRDEEGALRALRRRYLSLTPRERQVMGLVASGLMNKEVASELGTSEITVKIQRGKVMRKMQARSLADLVRMVERIERADRSRP